MLITFLPEPAPRLACCGSFGPRSPGGTTHACNEIHQSGVHSWRSCQPFALGQATSAQSTPHRKHVPITNAPSNSGKEMFNSYCAVCHGKDGKGDGPAASAMKTPPADLTLLAKKSSGQYPAPHVAAVIRGQATHPVAWQPGHAGLGTAVLEHQPGSRGPGTAENHESGALYRDSASEVDPCEAWLRALGASGAVL